MPQPTSTQLGAAIRRLRRSRGLSIEALALEAGVHNTSVSQIENGKRNPGWNTVASLANVLEVEIGDLARLAAKQPNSPPRPRQPPKKKSGQKQGTVK